MRTLSATLTANQKSMSRPHLLKVVIGAYTYGVDTTNRVLGLSHVEQEFSQLANIAVDNRDGNLTALTLHGSVCTISYGYDDEYSATAPLEIVAQSVKTDLQTGDLVAYFTAIGVFDMMGADKAYSAYNQEDTDTQTVKTLLTAIAEATLSCFPSQRGYKVFTITFDSEDSLIDTYTPADYFYVGAGESRLSVFKKLIRTTKCKAIIKADGAIHVFYPKITGDTWAKTTAYVRGDYVQPTAVNDLTYECTTAGTSGGTEPATWNTTVGGTTSDGSVTWTTRDYDYEYDDSASEHNFYEKGTRKRLVLPNRVEVSSHPDHTPQYWGYAQDSDTYTALGDRNIYDRPYYIRATSDAQCKAIATAILQHLQVESEKGHGLVPMNCGQEVMDYVKFTDSVANDTREGNIGYIARRYIPGREFSMKITFGRPVSEMPFTSFLGKAEGGYVTWEAWDALDTLLWGTGAVGVEGGIMGMLLEYEGRILALENREKVPKWHVTDQLIIPVEDE